MGDDRPFNATVRQVYALPDRHLLILETYRGDVGPGDRITVSMPDDGSITVTVRDLAWGSAFTADDPPLTLIIERLDGPAPESGATVTRA